MEAMEQSKEQTSAWEELNEHTDKHLWATWGELSTEPRLERRQWTSVFMMPETPGRSNAIPYWHFTNSPLALSVTAAVKDLKEKEDRTNTRSRRNGTTPVKQGLTEWIARGIEIEHVQCVTLNFGIAPAHPLPQRTSEK